MPHSFELASPQMGGAGTLPVLWKAGVCTQGSHFISEQSVLLLVFIRTIGQKTEFCKTDSGEKPQEIVGFGGTVFICIISADSQFWGAQEESNTVNFPFESSRPLPSAPQLHLARFAACPFSTLTLGLQKSYKSTSKSPENPSISCSSALRRLKYVLVSGGGMWLCVGHGFLCGLC